MLHIEMAPQLERQEFGYNYKWQEDLGFWYNTPVGSGKNPVQIFPPNNERTDWFVVVPRTETFQNLRGEGAEMRCFAIAAGFITQDQGPA